MQRLEVSGAVRPIYGSLGVKRLIYYVTKHGTSWITNQQVRNPSPNKMHYNILSDYASALYLVPGQPSRYSDSLRVGRFSDRIPAGARLSAPLQTDAGTQAASCTMGTRSISRG